jgi:hypothetical protein
VTIKGVDIHAKNVTSTDNSTHMRSLKPGEAANGFARMGANGSIDGGVGLGGSITGSVGFSDNPLVSPPTWITGGVSGGASIGAGGTVGVSYAFPIFKSQFKR